MSRISFRTTGPLSPPAWLFVSLAFAPFGIASLDASVPDRGGMRLVVENDVGFSDQFYTNGVRMEYLTRDSIAINPARWLAYLFTPLTELDAYGDDAGRTGYTSLFVSGDSFTPRYITKADVSFGDRPYASWTYLGSAYHLNDGREYLTAEIQAGGLGPGTGSREAQTFVHRNSRLSGSPNGWDHQIPYSTGLNLSVTYERQVLRTDPGRVSGPGATELLLFTRPRLGNIFTDLQAGFQINYGRLGPGDHQKYWRGDEYDGSLPYAYFYLRPSLRAVGYNATLEGPYTGGPRAVHIYRENTAARALAFHSLTRKNRSLSDAERIEAFDDLVQHRSTLDYRENFLTFLHTFYGQEGDNIGERMLIYETLFRETLPYEKPEEARWVVLHSLQQSKRPVTAENLFFWSNTVFRSDGESLHPYTRWIAFRKFTDDLELSPAEQVAHYAVLFNGQRVDQKNYGVPPARVVGEIDLGLSLGTGPLRFVLGLNVQTTDFERQTEIPDWHSWWHAEAVYLF